MFGCPPFWIIILTYLSPFSWRPAFSFGLNTPNNNYLPLKVLFSTKSDQTIHIKVLNLLKVAMFIKLALWNGRYYGSYLGVGIHLCDDTSADYICISLGIYTQRKDAHSGLGNHLHDIQKDTLWTEGIWRTNVSR